MSFGISPSITVREIDLTVTAQEQVSSLGSFAGKFRWGPVLQRQLVSNEDDLAVQFGIPSAGNAVDFLTLASFFAYSSGANVVRIGNVTDMKNAVSSGTAVAILNDDAYDQSDVGLSAIHYVARFPGALGNSLAVATCTSAAEFESALPGDFTFAVSPRSNLVAYTPDAAEVLTAYFNVGDALVVDGVRYTVIAVAAAQLTLDRIYVGSATPTTVLRRWAYASSFGSAPVSGKIHAVVVDKGGEFTREAGEILETFASMSLTAGAKYEDGTSSYYVDVINTQSQFVRVGGADPLTVNSGEKVALVQFVGGVDGFDDLGVDDYIAGYELFKNAEEVDAPLLISGDATSNDAVLANYIIQNIAEIRKDTMVFVSPQFASVVNNRNGEVNDIKADRDNLPSTSFAAMDSGWKYMFDKYNGVYRWVPLNGDHAGLYARVDREREAWYSAGGPQRGLIKNAVKLAWSPTLEQRDVLYTSGINPVTDFPGLGPTMFGDKTLLDSTSAFSRINVRRLFNVLETTIARAARELLFEFNDEFSQNRFVSIVEPFLRDVKGRRGITDYAVVADERVNTPAVVAANRFVGQIYVQPVYSINFIRLDFVAVGPTVSFTEVVGTV